jgi:hypothetical protein
VVLGATETGEGTFNNVIDRVLALIEVPSIVVRMPVDHPGVDRLPTRILVPVAATRSTRAAEEFAYSLVKASSGRVFALHVVNRPEGQGVLREDPAIEDSLEAGQELVGAAAVSATDSVSRWRPGSGSLPMPRRRSSRSETRAPSTCS